MRRTRGRVVHAVNPLSMVTLCGVSAIGPGWREERERRDRHACLRCLHAAAEETALDWAEPEALAAEWRTL